MRIFFLSLMAWLSLGSGVSLDARPESPHALDYLEAVSTNIDLAELIKFECVQTPSGIFDRYYLGSQKVFKGSVLKSPVMIEALEPQIAGMTFSPPSRTGILLILKQDSSGFAYSATEEDQMRAMPKLDQPVGAFLDIGSLLKVLLDSADKNNRRYGLALSWGTENAEVRKDPISISNRVPPQERPTGKKNLGSEELSNYLLTVIDRTQRTEIEVILKDWRERWNASDLNGMIAMLDDGTPPGTGERSRGVLEKKLAEVVAKGRLKNLTISRLSRRGDEYEVNVLYDFGDRTYEGFMYLRSVGTDLPKIYNFTPPP